MSNFTDFIGGGSDLPTLAGSQLPSYWKNDKENFKEGFAASAGSAIELPSNVNGSLKCHSATGSTLWTHASPAAVKGTDDDWQGFWMNDAADLLYVVTLDATPNPYTYTLSTINLAGAIVNIGSDQPSVEFNSPTSYWTTNGMIQPDGSGGFDIYKGSSSANNDEWANMDSSGTFTTAPAPMSVAEASTGIYDYMYKTDSNYWLFTTHASFTNMSSSANIHNGTDIAYIYLPYNAMAGTSRTSASGFMQWRDYVVGVDGNSQTLTASRKFSKAEIATFAQELAVYAGVAL